MTQSDPTVTAVAIELLEHSSRPYQSMVQGSYLRDGLQNVLRSASQFINSISIPGDSYRHVVVVTFVLRSRQTNVQFEIQELEGGVCKYH